MTEINPFSQEKLNEIFDISLKDNSRVNSRESRTIEFKQSFGWNSLPRYLKTCAAYANTKGGYIIFGISNCPHKLIGLSAEALQLFETIDPGKMTETFNNHFAPEVSWCNQIYEFNGKKYGIFYIYESSEKPVICIKSNNDDLREGDIYYRYRGRTQRIKYPELRSILECSREREQRIWMSYISRIAKIGIDNVGIFDLTTGQVTGSGTKSFLIDESLLSQISFIKEGEFSEIKGKQTLKLLGNLQAADTFPFLLNKQYGYKAKAIRLADIVLAYLNQQVISQPKEYIKQICFETTAFLPVYYYIYLSKQDSAAIIEMLNGVISRLSAKKKLTERIISKRTQALTIGDKNNKFARIKREFISQIKQGQIDDNLTGKNLQYCLQAIRCLSPAEITNSKDRIFTALKSWFNRYYGDAPPSLADSIRRTICWTDEAIYMDKCKN